MGSHYRLMRSVFYAKTSKSFLSATVISQFHMNKNTSVKPRIRRSFMLASIAAFSCLANAQSLAEPAVTTPPPTQPVADNAELSGTVIGRITEASRNRPIPRIEVQLDNGASVLSDSEGRFRFDGIAQGTYALRISDSEYAAAERPVSVNGGEQTVVNMSLQAASSSEKLGRVVVKGMSGAATQRSVSSPISMLTETEIERRQATNLTDLLRGQLPGMSILGGGATDWTTIVNARGDTSWNNAGSDMAGDYMKILIDDVEIVRPTLLSMLDPKSISQIEIIRGPMAGAMYGAEASSGVMRITTKKGRLSQDPEFVAQASVGVIESDARPSGKTPMVLDKSVQVTGGGELLSYRVGVSQSEVGEWSPGYDSRSRMASGAVQGSYGKFGISASAIHTDRNMVYVNKNYPMSESLVAATMEYTASPNWHHTLTVGYDSNHFGYEGLTSNPDDTSKSSEYERTTVRYFTNYDTRLGKDFTARFTLGADLIRYQSYEVDGYEAPGHDHGDAEDHSHDPVSWRKVGYYGVAELGWRDQAYLTLAGRMDGDIYNVSPEHRKKFQPRVGLSYVLGEHSNTMAKLRTQWGTSARSPTGDLFRTVNGPRWATIAAQNIKPEEKVGWDAGVDLSIASIGSLSVTYFDEEGRDLVMPVIIVPGYWNYMRPDLTVVEVEQFKNYGLVSNKGWEFEARMRFGPVALRANATVADNRIEKLSNAYPGQFAPEFTVGARRIDVPKHAGGVSATIDAFKGTISIDGTWIGPRVSRFTTGLRPTIWQLGLRTEQKISDQITFFGRIDNALNKQEGERFAFDSLRGRTAVVGLQYTF